MIYAWIAIVALIVDNLVSDFVLHNSSLNVVMFVLFWFLSGTIMGLVLCQAKQTSYKQNFKALQPYWGKLSLYLAASVIAPFLWMQAVLVVGIGDSVLLAQAATLIPIVFGALYFKEKFSAKDIFFLSLVALGVVTFLYKGSQALGLGALLVLVASSLYAVQGIFKKIFAGNVDYVFVITLRAFCTTLAALIVALATGLFVLPTEWWVYALCFFGGTVGSFANKYYWFKSMESVDLSRFAIISEVKTVLVYLLAVAFLNETITEQKIIGGSLILAGAIFFSTRKKEIK